MTTSVLYLGILGVSLSWLGVGRVDVVALKQAQCGDQQAGVVVKDDCQ